MSLLLGGGSNLTYAEFMEGMYDRVYIHAQTLIEVRIEGLGAIRANHISFDYPYFRTHRNYAHEFEGIGELVDMRNHPTP